VTSGKGSKGKEIKFIWYPKLINFGYSNLSTWANSFFYSGG
jgi:hypothetical protein